MMMMFYSRISAKGRYVSMSLLRNFKSSSPPIPDIILNIVCEMPNPLNCGFVKDDDAQYTKSGSLEEPWMVNSFAAPRYAPPNAAPRRCPNFFKELVSATPMSIDHLSYNHGWCTLSGEAKSADLYLVDMFSTSKALYS